jgi:hypothetical protein
MKRLIFNSALSAALLGGMTNADAHDGSGTLGADAAATDYVIISCDNNPGPTEHLLLQLTGGVPATAPTVSAQIQIPDQQIATSVTDPVNGDLGSSRPVEVHGGTAAYHVTFDKTGPGTANYSYVYHCETAGGEHTGTTPNGGIKLQDQ